MPRRLVPVLALFGLIASICGVNFLAASPTLRIDEAATRLMLQDEKTKVSLAVENFLGREVAARVRLELLDPQDRVRAKAESEETIKPGAGPVIIPFALSFPELGKDERRRLLWYRLRYRLTPNSSAAGAVDVSEGLISLSEITPDIFELSVAASEYARQGTRYRARVRTAHPVTSRPVGGVKVAGEVKFDSRPKGSPLKSSAVTDSEGYATLEFDLPREVEADEAQVTVTASRGEFAQEAEAEVRFDQRAQILVSTDKPLYQPGQVLHVRALVFDPSRHAVAGAEAALKISDPESTVVFRAPLKTSRFGVASVDWPIPENTRLGDYFIEVEMDEGSSGDSHGGQYVKISRYELPNFTVSVKPDRAYYLPGHNAEVEVRADYLFGQPVTRGRVRVVRETERHWNYREQKWETKEGDKYEGETDGTGRFIARINLAEGHKDLADEDSPRFRDLTYAAYLTDLTTGRTEQRRFDLRVTKDAIHVYLIEGDSGQTEEFPLQFYLSTSYADGTPASCEVAISEIISSTPSSNRISRATSEPPLRTVKTNRYGVAKVGGLVLAGREDLGQRLSLNFLARDNQGRLGRHTESLWLGSRPVIRVETDKTLYHAGEPIKAEITASEPDLTVFVDVARDWTVIHSEMVRLRQGHATVLLPYGKEFKDELTIAAYANLGSGRSDQILGARRVLYPRDRDLKLDVRLNQAAYRPGEEARADFLVRAPDGRPLPSALGVVVFDQAVEERARTDREFGAGYGFYGAYRSLTGDANELAGVARKDLDRIDLSKPLPDGLELVAEILLRGTGYTPQLFGGDDYKTDQREVFSSLIDAQLKTVKETLETQYLRRSIYPKDEASLRRLLIASGINLGELKDPWGTPYRARFSTMREKDVLEIASAGADKRFDTADDFIAASSSWPYFRFHGEAINRAVERYHTRTGDFIRDAATLQSELRREGIDFDALRDPWGQPYRFQFGVSGINLTVSVRSSGPDGRFDEENHRSPDDFTIWAASIDYAAELRGRLNAALAAYFEAAARFPQNESELRDALRRSGIDLDSLRDPWGRTYYATFKSAARYADRVIIQNYARYGEAAKQRTDITPVTQQINFIYLRSRGEDGQEGTADDFDVAGFSRILAERASQDSNPQPANPSPALPRGSGAITGTITDASGAVVPGATVKAVPASTTLVYETKSDEQGHYLLRNLPAGLYEVRIEATGFRVSVFVDVPIHSSNITKLDAVLNVGAVSEAVAISASVAPLQTDARSMASLVQLKPGISPVPRSGQAATPRLREYFPETLVWQPSLETDRGGRAQLKFKLADTITTWKLSVIGSTVDGGIGTAEREIRAFQPFFVEHDPPRVLTEGDEIALPVVLRNYLDKAQVVDVEIKPENWFALLGPARKRAAIAAGDASRETFDFRALAAVSNGKQRVTASGPQASDAVEKTVTVHPNGEEIVQTASQVLGDAASLEIAIPDDAISGSARAELKIYPNLMAHALEGIEGILQRPYGCGEQTISSTYPNLMVLRYLKRLGEAEPAIAAKAQRYLQAGYERLLNYREGSGGFSYWGRGEADLALTAYALRFLSDAQEFISVDEEVIEKARAWLIKQQRVDGSWSPYALMQGEDKRQAASLTSFIARVLAATKTGGEPNSSSRKPAAGSTALTRAFDYLSRQAAEVNEPYLIASYALAALDAGEWARAAWAVEKLCTLPREEAGTNYWALESNTPFHGWGLAGRLETTALAVRALALAREITEGAARGGKAEQKPENERKGSLFSVPPAAKDLVNRGLLFLLRNKDRYGVWLSTQATVNVLDALITLDDADKGRPSAGGPAEVAINGRPVKTVAMPPVSRLTNPLTVDLTPFLSAGRNRIEVRRATSGVRATAQVVATHYVPWKQIAATKTESLRPGAASALRLAVKFDQSESKVGDEITCRVEAERIGSRGYGMMLAEVGLPPGAEVDRTSLERAVKESGWGLNHYDVLPDRLIVYLWPRAGGTRFEFKFRPRFGLKAQTAPSVLYDYYNPEARVVVAPTKFVVE